MVKFSQSVTNILHIPPRSVSLLVLRKSLIRGGLITGSASDPAQSVHSHTLKRPPHQRMLLQDLVETVHAQGVKATVGVGLHGGCASSLGQQADL